MKRLGRHPENELTALRVKGLKDPGRYADGGGLYLEIDRNGAKRWLLRLTVQGRRRDLGLGGVRDVTLAEAREKTAEYRKIAKAGGDPAAEKRKASRTVPTFKAAAEAVHAEHRAGWRNPKHATQWLSALQTHVFPAIGDRRIDQIDTADLLRVLGPIWLQKPVTAKRLRQRMRVIFDWAKVAGFRSGDNPADSVAKGLPRHVERPQHLAAMSYTEVPAFARSLSVAPIVEASRLALELLILTATRTSEAIEARKDEFDLERRVWTIPAARMKAGREHRIPLSDRAIAILRRAFELSADSAFVFTSQSPRKPISSMALLLTLRRMGVGRAAATVHGFRSAFRDWVSEKTNFPHQVAEMALAHTVRDKVEAAYRRGDLFEKRAQMMSAWAAFVTAGPGNVVQMAARRG